LWEELGECPYFKFIDEVLWWIVEGEADDFGLMIGGLL